jgi:hypothetical protein
VNRDFRDLIAAFNAQGVEFLVVGAHALAAHGRVAPVRIDVLTDIAGVRFTEAWTSRMMARFVDQEAGVLSQEHLIRNKRATGRTQDLADAEWLERRAAPRNR